MELRKQTRTETKDKNAEKAIKELKKMNTNDNIHKDHRKRLKSQFLDSGLSSLPDIQKLELLLFYAIPLKDTNALAHKLLNEFGSLKDVLTADVNSLVTISGIKENTAILINLVGGLFSTISMPSEGEFIGSSNKAKEFCEKLFVGAEVEQFYVICLTKTNRVKKFKLIKAGTTDEVNIQIRSITEFAIASKCDRIIVSHNHPAGIGAVSDEDCKFTYSLLCSCMLNSIELIDHIVVGTDKSISMSAQKVLDRLKQKTYDSLHVSEEKRTYLSSLSEEYKID